MKHLKLIIAFLLAGLAAQAQIPGPSVKIKWTQIQIGAPGQVAIVGTDSVGHWVTPPFLNISDTAAMLAGYQAAINARVKYSDTAAMLALYLQQGDNISLLTNDAGYLTSFTESDPIYVTDKPNVYRLLGSLNTGDDVNNMTVANGYYQITTTVMPTLLNIPSYTGGPAGILEVINGTAYKIQRFHFIYASSKETYERKFSSGTWSSWQKVWSGADFTSTNISNWNTAFGWGNHASAGYEVQSNKATTLGTANNTLYPTTKAAKDNDISALSVTGTTTKTITATRPNGNLTASWTDNNTEYLAGYGMNLTGTTFKVDTTKIASYDAGGKIPFSRLPATLMIYKGVWNAVTNTPTLQDGMTGAQSGWVYKANPGGTINLGSGNITFADGDWAIYNGTTWEKSKNSDAVASVNGMTGIVSLTTTDIPEGTNKYYTDTRARQAISLTTTGTSGAATYNNTTGVINVPDYSATDGNFVKKTGDTMTGYLDLPANSSNTGLRRISPSSSNWARPFIMMLDTSGTVSIDGMGHKGSNNGGSEYGYLGAAWSNNAINWTIDNKVGIGLSGSNIPAYKLDVNGQGRFSTINNATGDFVTADVNGVLNKRTAAQVASDIGAVTTETDPVYSSNKPDILMYKGALPADNVHNLNDYKETGVFYQAGNTNASLAQNYPVGQSGLLTVWGNTSHSMTIQEYNKYNSTDIYRRFYYNSLGTWTPWVKLWTDGNFTQSDVTNWNTAYSQSHAAVTLAGQNYLSLSGQQITANPIGLATSNVTGQLPVNKGGTGAATLTGYVKGNGTGAMTANATIPASDITGLPTAPIPFPEEFTGSTSSTITLTHAPISAAYVIVTYNGQTLTSADWSVAGTTLTLSFTRTADDVILCYYSY